MVCEVLRRYLRNLMAFIVSKPPCVIFTTCLALLAVALFCLGFFVNNHEIIDPEAQKEWDDFLIQLSNIQFCVNEDKIKTIKSSNTEQSLSNLTTLVSKPDFVAELGQLVAVSVPLKIGIALWSKLHRVHSNISHFTALVDIPVIRYGSTSSRQMNLTFSLSGIWNQERKTCNTVNKCKLPQGLFDSCVTILAPRNVLPEWKPSTCNSSAVDIMSSMKQLTLTEQRKKTCTSGAVVYFKHPVNLKLREKLSVAERAKANLHLQMTSYFLFILVISSIIYGMIRGRAVKTKKVSFELSSGNTM